MKYIFIILSLFLFSNKIIAQEQENYFINSDEEKVIMYRNIKGKSYYKYDHIFDSDYALTGQFFYYHDNEGELIKEKQSKVKDIYYDGRHYSNLEIANVFGSNRLHEIIVENENYVLTQYYFSGGYYSYIADKSKGKFILGKHRVSKDKEKDIEFFEDKIKSYFKDCEEFLALVNKSLDGEYLGDSTRPRNNLFYYVSNYDCR
ncbi:MAG: hypothetical protein KDC69_01350 [Flavobacteriaceae bacterium]|nr:hypothetical protein [Mangrovimonas sp.]MCB0474285.1 hypothetical protein [Flavobacteriaceae bacterium]